MSTVLSASVTARSADHLRPPCATERAASFSGLRPSSTASGTSRSPFLSKSPPSLRMASTELMRCWFVPRRPVTPSIATRSVLVAMIARNVFLGGTMQLGRPPCHGAPAALEHRDRLPQLGDRLTRARRLQHGHVGRIADLDPVVRKIHQLRRPGRYHLEAFGNALRLA